MLASDISIWISPKNYIARKEKKEIKTKEQNYRTPISSSLLVEYHLEIHHSNVIIIDPQDQDQML